MAVRDTWRRALEYFGLVEGDYIEEGEYEEGDTGTEPALDDTAVAHREPARSLPSRRRARDEDIDDIFGDEPRSSRRETSVLRPVGDATTVRMRGGQVLITDGPFAETREWIAGFDILECADLDEAIKIAAEHPMARSGRLELRPFWDGQDGGPPP